MFANALVKVYLGIFKEFYYVRIQGHITSITSGIGCYQFVHKTS